MWEILGPALVFLSLPAEPLLHLLVQGDHLSGVLTILKQPKRCKGHWVRWLT